jgi:hypothetical protein
MSSTSANTLLTQGGTGAQSTTQDPQTSPTSSTSLNGQTTNLQQGDSATSLLTSGNGGIPLQSNQVSATSLSSTTSSPSQTAVTNTQPQHHGLNPVLLTISIVLFIAAVGLFISTSRSAKTTTQ